MRQWLREHYNDAVAVEMEAAGVAQAGHLNDGLPAIMVRGISDYADEDQVRDRRRRLAAPGGSQRRRVRRRPR